MDKIRVNSQQFINSNEFRIARFSTNIVILLIVLNIFSSYINSWLLNVPVPSIGSVFRDLVFIFAITALLLVVLIVKRYYVAFPVVAWILAAAFTLFLVPFSSSLFTGLMGYRNIFYPLAGIFIITCFHRSDSASFHALRLRKWTSNIFGLIAVFGILDFATAGNFPQMLGYNPQYNDQVAMLVRKHLGITRANAGVADALNYGYLMAFSALYGTYLLGKRNTSPRFFTIALTVMSCVACILSMTRGAIIALFLTILCYFIVKAPFKSFCALIALSVCLAIYVPTTEYGKIVLDRFTESDAGSKSSSVIRIKAVETAIDQISQRPFIGVGLGTQGAATAYQELDLRIATDNSFFWILLETGILGFTLIYGAYIYTFYYLFTNAADKNYRRFLVLSLLLLLIASALSSAPVSPTFALSYWIIIVSEYYALRPLPGTTSYNAAGNFTNMILRLTRGCI